MDSTRLKTLKALTDLLKTITVANGYQHDLSSAVYRGRNRFDDRDPLPRLSLMEAPTRKQTDAPEGGNAQREDWELYLQGWVTEDIENPTDPAHLLLADVKKCLSRIRDEDGSDFTLNGLIHDLNIGGGVCRPSDESSTEAFFLLNLSFLYVEDTDDPYG